MASNAWNRNVWNKPSSPKNESAKNETSTTNAWPGTQTTNNVWSKNQQMPGVPKNVLTNPAFFKLNRKQMTDILKFLDLEDMSRLSSTNRRLNNCIKHYVKAIQVFVDWGDEPDLNHNLNEHSEDGFEPVVLQTCSPLDFFYRKDSFIPFPNIQSLFLSYDDDQGEILNLTLLMQLKYLKIRGKNVRLSSSGLPSVTHINIDDPDNCEKQVFKNLRNFHLEVTIDEFSSLKNSTESQSIEYIFKKSLDILLDKDLQQVSFKIILAEMELLIFEMLVDSLTTFLNHYNREIVSGFVCLIFKHPRNYGKEEDKVRRWQSAWDHLTNLEVEKNNFKLIIEDFDNAY